jgi:hypothetical protein
VGAGAEAGAGAGAGAGALGGGGSATTVFATVFRVSFAFGGGPMARHICSSVSSNFSSLWSGMNRYHSLVLRQKGTVVIQRIAQ